MDIGKDHPKEEYKYNHNMDKYKQTANETINNARMESNYIMQSQENTIRDAPSVYGEKIPVHLDCPNCHENVLTKTKPHISNKQWIICLVMFVLGCDFCCLGPCYIPSCYDYDHLCSNCGFYIGSSK
ncbi:unnamed protein product [Moneuplotes crassus]|uniref:LITAF domain-containing protein n=1 Tax=Euplotes crassus TaxID=5936 RepID=A0AAD2D834_EUPCR|nr:unnamed protein product [Moneuplotes crassus]